MAHDIYTGYNVKITLNSITKRFRSIRIRTGWDKFEANPSDTKTRRRGSGLLDAGITLVGFESDEAGAGDFADIQTAVIAKTAPTALTWTDDAGTPVSRLASTFFTEFPLAKWRIDSCEGGSGGPTDPNEWTAELTPNNDD